MNPFEMVVMIVAIVTVGSIFRGRVGHIGGRRGRRFGAQEPGEDLVATAEDAADKARLREEIQALKTRVATLERIVTDSSTALDREIEALRDKR